MSDRRAVLLEGFRDPADEDWFVGGQFRFAFSGENTLLDLVETFEAEDDANEQANHHHIYTDESVFPARHRMFWTDKVTGVLRWVMRATRALSESNDPEKLNDAEAAWRRYWQLEDFARAHVVLSRVFRDEMDRVTERRGVLEPAYAPPIEWVGYKIYDVSDEIKDSLRARAREVARGAEGSPEREYDAQWVATVWIANERFDALRTLVG